MVFMWFEVNLFAHLMVFFSEMKEENKKVVTNRISQPTQRTSNRQSFVCTQNPHLNHKNFLFFFCKISTWFGCLFFSLFS